MTEYRIIVKSLENGDYFTLGDHDYDNLREWMTNGDWYYISPLSEIYSGRTFSTVLKNKYIVVKEIPLVLLSGLSFTSYLNIQTCLKNSEEYLNRFPK